MIVEDLLRIIIVQKITQKVQNDSNLFIDQYYNNFFCILILFLFHFLLQINCLYIKKKLNQMFTLVFINSL